MGGRALMPDRTGGDPLSEHMGTSRRLSIERGSSEPPLGRPGPSCSDLRAQNTARPGGVPSDGRRSAHEGGPEDLVGAVDVEHCAL